MCLFTILQLVGHCLQCLFLLPQLATRLAFYVIIQVIAIEGTAALTHRNLIVSHSSQFHRLLLILPELIQYFIDLLKPCSSFLLIFVPQYESILFPVNSNHRHLDPQLRFH